MVTLEMPKDAANAMIEKGKYSTLLYSTLGIYSTLLSEPNLTCQIMVVSDVCHLTKGCMTANMDMRFVSVVGELGTTHHWRLNAGTVHSKGRTAGTE